MYVLRLNELPDEPLAAFGGKAAGLAALLRAGFLVPDGYGVHLDAFRAFVRQLPPAEHPGALLGAASAADVARVRDHLLRAPLPGDVSREIEQAYAEIGQGAVAVRSSATTEDLAGGSSAGLQDTVLDVRGRDALLDSVRRCFASLYSERVVAYLKRMGLVSAGIGVGVVVQRMVPAEVSGVLFTMDPVGGAHDRLVINAARGLGAGLVGGRVSPETVVYDKRTLRILDRSSPAEGPVLTERQAAEVAEVGRRVEERLGMPVDVEWAICEGRVFLLQARPITAVAPRQPRRSWPLGSWFRPRRVTAAQEIVWSNVNVGEALPGVASPLTWSILSQFSEVGFRRAFAALGCKLPPNAELVGNFRGRIYLNLSTFMGIAAQVPGLSPRTLLALGGGADSEAIELLEASSTRNPVGFLLRLPQTAARLVASNAGLLARIERFEDEFAVERRAMRTKDLTALAAPQLLARLDATDAWLDRTGTLMLTCASNSLSSFLALQALLRRVAPADAERLQAELMTGLSDLESAAPGMALWHIAEIARADEAVLALLGSRDPATLRVSDLAASNAVKRALEAFLEAYGDRAVREAELMTPRWSEAPGFLFAALRGLVEASDRGPLQALEERRAVRLRAAKDLEDRLSSVPRASFRHLLALAQRYTRLRERLRARVVEVLAMYRRLALEVSRRLGSPDAAFFLRAAEIKSYLCGELVDPAALCAERREEYERDILLPDPPDTFVGFPPLLAAAHGASGAGVLRGLAASPGRVEGVARVLVDPAQAGSLKAGEILVVRYADVGWSPLFLIAAAVVADLGGPLSHASVVAREYGVPAVVNVKVGTRLVQTGDRLIVDGDRGEVLLLPRPS